MKTLLSLAGAACLVSVCVSPAAAHEAPATVITSSLTAEGVARLDRWAKETVSSKRLTGNVVLVLRNGEVAFYENYGLADRNSGRQLAKDDIFRIYSMTKPVVSVALLMLYEEGKFQLNDPLEQYIPEFAGIKVSVGVNADGSLILEEPRQKPTVLDAFRHTLGLSAGGGSGPVDQLYVKNGILVGQLDSLAQQMQLLGKVPLQYHPGERWLYGYGHDVQAHLVERLSGMKLDDFLQQRIFAPLKMNDTGYGVPAAKRGRVAALHDVPDTPPANPAVDMRPSTYERFAQHPLGTLGLWSTASDYGRFGQMLLQNGELDGVRILGRKTVELMTENHLPPAIGNLGAAQRNPGTGYGLGVSVQIDVAADANLASKSAFGWSGAATTHFIVDPEEQMVAVFMSQKAPFDSRILDEFQTMVYQSVK